MLSGQLGVWQDSGSEWGSLDWHFTLIWTTPILTRSSTDLLWDIYRDAQNGLDFSCDPLVHNSDYV